MDITVNLVIVYRDRITAKQILYLDVTKLADRNPAVNQLIDARYDLDLAAGLPADIQYLLLLDAARRRNREDNRRYTILFDAASYLLTSADDGNAVKKTSLLDRIVIDYATYPGVEVTAHDVLMDDAASGLAGADHHDTLIFRRAPLSLLERSLDSAEEPVRESHGSRQQEAYQSAASPV